jgi:hypothetical protein
MNINCVLIFSTTSHCKKKSARYCHKCENIFMQSTRFSCRILTKLEFSPQIFEKVSNIKFHQVCRVGAALSHADRQTDRGADGRTDGHDEA